MEGIPHVSNEELARLRDSLPNYKFRIFDSSFSRSYGQDAELLLSYGRELLYESAEISEDRLLLAKAEGGGRTVALYVATTMPAAGNGLLSSGDMQWMIWSL